MPNIFHVPLDVVKPVFKVMKSQLAPEASFLAMLLFGAYRILWWQSRDAVIWPQWNLWDHAGWQGHCIQTSDEEVKQVRVCT